MTANAAAMQRMRKKRRAARQCVDCGDTSQHFRCKVCRGRQADLRCARNIDRIAEGLCTRCANRRRPGRTMCEPCLDYFRGRKRPDVELVVAIVAVAS